MSKILKLKNNGEDFGYVTLEGEVFYGGGSKTDAVKFELEKYKNGSEAHYFKVSGTKESYMDLKYATSRLQVVKPTFSVGSSTICAWELVSDELRMIVKNNFTGKCLSRSTSDLRSDALYGNLTGHHCDVTIEDA